MSTRQTYTFPPVSPEYIGPEIETSPEVRAEYAAAMPQEPDPCLWCQRITCVVTYRIHPHPGPFPLHGVLTDLVEACHCCTWGSRGLHARVQCESHKGRDIQVEHLDLSTGHWSRFEIQLKAGA